MSEAMALFLAGFLSPELATIFDEIDNVYLRPGHRGPRRR